MLRETPDDRRVAAPGLHLTHVRVTIVVVWKRFVKKMNLLDQESCTVFAIFS